MSWQAVALLSMAKPHEPLPSGFETLSDPEALRVLSHPTRAKVFMMAVHQPVSATDVARHLDQPVDRVSYHMRALAEARLITPVRRTRRRGATETHYRAVATFDVSDEAMDTSPGLRTTMYSVVADELGADLSHATRTGAGEDPDFHLARGHFRLTEEGRRRLVEEVRSMHQRLADLAVELRAETEAEGATVEHEMSVVLALYEGDTRKARNRPWTASREWPDVGEPPLIGTGQPIDEPEEH